MNRPISPPKLILGRVPPTFRPGIDIVFDPAAFAGIEADWPAWDELPFIDAYSDTQMPWADWCRTRALANEYARRLGSELNVRHNTRYGHAYWRELLILWLLLLIQAARVRDLALTGLLETRGGERIAVEIPTCERWVFTDDLDFMNRGIRNADFDAWLCGRLLLHRLPENWQIVETPVDQDTTVAAMPEPRYPRILPRVDSIPGMGRISHLFSALLHLRHPDTVRPLLSDQFAEADGDPEKDGFPESFRKVVDELITATMPEIFTRHFDKFDAGARRYGFKAGKRIVTAATKYRPENRFILAHAKQAGEQIYRAQHGAGYGVARLMMAQEIEYFDSGFLSWGWRQDSVLPVDAMPLPSPLIARVPKWSPRNNNVALISTNAELSAHPFKGGPRSGQWLTYRRWKTTFVNALSDAPRANLIYRPRRGARNDLADVEYLRDRVGDIRILEGDFNSVIRRCKVAVLDHPGSAMHSLMAMGIPTVMFWERDAWLQHPEAEPAFNGLRDNNILFHDPAEAAAHIGSIFDKPTKWWDQPAVREARENWCNNFAAADHAWRRKWLAWLLRDQTV